MKYKIRGIANGFIKSGSYGGSLPKEAFPSEYNYTFYDIKTEKDKQKAIEFQNLIDEYLEQTLVNGSLTLKEYIELLYNKDTETLADIHSKFEDRTAKGNSHQVLPILIFIDDSEGTVLRVSLRKVKLNYPKAAQEMQSFLERNAKKFNSTIPDSFYNTHYKID